MTVHRHADLELFIDLTTTTHSQGRTVGAVRVEAECASALLRAHPDGVPVSWSPSEERFLSLDRVLADRFLAHDGCSVADVKGSSVEESFTRHDSRRRVLLVIGAGWLSNTTVLHALFRLGDTLGAELHVVIHDLVHLLFPHWEAAEDSARFGSNLEAMLSRADRLLVFSKSTENDIRRVAAMRAMPPPRIGHIVNATTAVEATPGATLSAGLEGLSRRPFVLYVSTLAPRKNHAFICQVWGRLAAELESALPLLVLVGRVPPDQAIVVDRLRRDPSLADQVLFLTEASDADLVWLYQQCQFTVFPSLYEGWGLPVAESLAAGKVCLASNTSSLPEVSAGLTPLIDPLDFHAWCNSIRELVLRPEVRAAAEQRIREDFRPVVWAEVAVRLWQGVSAPAVAFDRRPQLVADSGQRSVAIASVAAVREPWRALRGPTGQAIAQRSRLGVPLAELPPHGLRLGLSISTDSPAPMRVETEINGLVTDGCVLHSATTEVRRFELPRDLLLRRGLLDIVTVARPLEGRPTSDDAPVTFLEVTAVALSRDEETAAVEMRRDVWRLGDLLHFTGGSPHLPLLRRGWGEPAHWGVWSIDPVAAISFRPMPQPSEPLVLRMAVRGFVPPAQPALDADVLVNGTRLATWSFRHPTDFTFVERVVVIPPDLLVDGVVHLQLSIPGARSPRDMGMSQDERRLGVGLARAHCTTRSGPQPDTDWLRRRRSVSPL